MGEFNTLYFVVRKQGLLLQIAADYVLYYALSEDDGAEATDARSGRS